MSSKLRVPPRHTDGAWASVASTATTYAPWMEEPSDLQRADAGGVALLWARAPEPITGTLLFRAGRADETLRTAGISHLVEHLALREIGRRPYQWNGRVNDATTAFFATGTRDEVLGYLTEVAAALSALPLERTTAEKRLLLTEAGLAADDLDARLLAMRFGPCGFGLVNSPELGLGWLGADDVAAWAAQRFTAANASLWLSAPPPADWTLDLPGGEATPPPPVEPIPSLELPCQLAEGTGGVALSAVGQRSSELQAGWFIAAERAHERLRREAGISYSPMGTYVALDGKTAHLVLSADCKDPDAGRVRDELLAVLDELADGGPTEAELAWDRSVMSRSLDEQRAPLGILEGGARDLLMGVEPMTRAQLLHDREALTADAVATAVRGVLDTLIAVVPTDLRRRPDDRLPEYAPERRDRPDGRVHRPTARWRLWRERSELHVGEGFLSYRLTDPDDALTWRFEDVVAGIPGLSGSLTVVGRDDYSIVIHPHRYQDGLRARDDVAAALGPSRTVPPSDRERALAPLVERELPATCLECVGAEVDTLPEVLAEQEEPRHLAQAAHGGRCGLVALSDQRLLFAFMGTHDRELVDIPLHAIRAVAVKGLRGKRLVVTHADGELELRAVRPAGRLRQLAAALQDGRP